MMQQECRHYYRLGITHNNMSQPLQWSLGHPPMVGIYFTVKFELPTL